MEHARLETIWARTAVGEQPSVAACRFYTRNECKYGALCRRLHASPTDLLDYLSLRRKLADGTPQWTDGIDVLTFAFLLHPGAIMPHVRREIKDQRAYTLQALQKAVDDERARRRAEFKAQAQSALLAPAPSAAAVAVDAVFDENDENRAPNIQREREPEPQQPRAHSLRMCVNRAAMSVQTFVVVTT